LKTVNLDYNSFERRASFTGTKFGGGGKKLESESEGGQTCLPASRNSFHLASLKLGEAGQPPSFLPTSSKDGQAILKFFKIQRSDFR